MPTRTDDSLDESKKVSFLAAVHSFIDSNLQLIRTGLYVVGGIGLVITARGLYLHNVFTRVEEIPANFVRKRIRLQGTVRDITADDVLSIEHIPVFKVRLPFTKQKQSKEYLPVHLACIDLSPEGRVWLNDNILHKVVWFRLLHRTPSESGYQSQLYSKIQLPRKYRGSLPVNEELVKQGLARISSVSSIESIQGIQTNPHLLKYLDKLISLENNASKKGRGMWLQPSESSLSKKGLNVIKYVIYSPYTFIKWIYSKRKKK